MRRAKKWLAGALAVLLLVNLLPASALAEEENAGEEPAAVELEENTAETLSRARLAELLYANERLKASIDSAANGQTAVSFDNIDNSCTPEQKTAISAMAQARVLNGTAAGTFTPDGTVTRAQAAVVLWRAAGCLSNTTSAELPYTDVDSIPAWAVAAVNCLYALGVLENTTADFRPNENVTAEEMQAWLGAYDTLSVETINGIAVPNGTSRAEMLEIFYDAYQDVLPELPKAYTTDFDDIADCTDNQKAVITLFHTLEYEDNVPIVVGVAEGQFEPFAPVTNRQVSALLHHTIVYIERAKSSGEVALSSFDGMELQSDDSGYDATLTFLMERGLSDGAASTIRENPNAPGIRSDIKAWSNEVQAAGTGDLDGSTGQDETVADIVVTDGVAEVGNYLGFAAALADNAVQSIRIIGSVVIPAASTALDAGSKGITVCESGSLALAPGAVLVSSAPMYQFSYEDQDHTWGRISDGMDVFLLWRDENDNVHRELYGTQPDEDELNALLNKTGNGSLITAVFRDDVTLTGDATIQTLVIMGQNTALTIQDGASLTIKGYLHVEDGSLHVLSSGSLAFGDEGEGWVNGDVEFRDGQPPEKLHWGGAGLWPHLVALEYNYDSNDPTELRWGDFRSDLWMTPLDEPEVVFGFLYFDEGEQEWQFDLGITVDLGGLTYQQREDQEQRWYLSGAEWDQTYNITYTAEDSTVYTLPVYVELPELGYYKAPEATEDNYINRFAYTPGNDTFYLCVNPNAWFLQEEGIGLADPVMVWGDSGKITCVPAVDENGSDIPNVWKITVSGGEFWAEYRMDILRNGQWDGDIRCGIEIREGNYPHLVALDYDYESSDPTAVRTEYYNNAYWITPTYEPEVVLAFLHEKGGQWIFDTNIAVTLTDTTLEDGPCGLTYEQRNDRDGRMVLSGAEWDHTYEVSYTAEDGVTYTLPVHVVLPTAGYYKAPAATKDAFINHWEYIPTSENVFYLCVDPNEWFMQEEGVTLADPVLVRGDPERVSCQAVEGKTGVWKITVTGCDFDIEYELRAFRGEEEVYQDRCGLWVEMGKYPHLVVLDYDYESDDPMAVRMDHYNDALSMTPGDEPDLVFAFMYEEDGQWRFDTNIAVDAGGLTYEARDDRDGRMVLSGAEWDKTYTVTYTAADSTVYTLPVYVELPDLGYYSAPEVSRETYINRFDYTPLSRNEFYLCARPDAWFMEDPEVSLGELQLWNADGSQISVEPVGKGIWKITVTDCEFSAVFELPVFRGDREEGRMGRGIWISAGELLAWSTQLLTEEPGDVDYNPANMQLSNTLTLYPGSGQDVALYLLRYEFNNETKTGKWVCEYTGSEWVRGEGVMVDGIAESCRVTANAVGTHSIVRLDGREVITEEGYLEYQPIPGSTRGIPLTVIVEERNLPVEIDWESNTALLTNEMSEPIAVQMILAAYDADGRMCSVNARASFSLGVGESLELTADIPQGKDVTKFKVFALDPETRKPFCQALDDKYVPNLTVDASGTISGGTYRNVTVTAAVGDGEVTLEDVTILGELIIQGGGSSSIKLHSCAVNGKVVLDKTTTDESTQQPRLELTETPVSRVVACQPAIIEAVDAASSVQEVKAAASVEIKGTKTVVNVVKALAPVTITAGKVNTVAVVDDKTPSTAQVAVTVGSGASVGEVAVHSSAGAVITNNGMIQAVSAANGDVADKVDRKGTSDTPAPAAHIHSWDNGIMNRQPTCNTPGQVTRTCTVDGCGAQKKTTVPALGHDYASAFDSNETGHWHVCDRCGEHGRKDAHTYPAADCKQAATCTVCGYQKPAGDHAWDKGVVTKNPTFTEWGEKTYTCTSCGTTMVTDKHPLATDDQLELIQKADSWGLLAYLPRKDINDLGDVTRLEMAKLIAAFCGLQVTPTTVAPFSDCGGLTDLEKGVLNAAVQAQLIYGYKDGTFGPSDVMTRAQVAQIVYRLLGEPTTDCTKEFADVQKDQWFWAAVTNLYNLGIIAGTSDNTFSPFDAADKRVALTLLVRAKNFQSSRTPVPTVTGAYFVKTNAALKLKVDAPADMSNIADFRLEFMDSNGVWMEYGGFLGGIPIFGDGLNGAYIRLRITSIPKDYSAYTEGVFEMPCVLSVKNQQLNAPDAVAFSKIVSGSSTLAYSAEVRGLTLDADQVVVELAERYNGNGNRGQMAGNGFFNQDTSAGTQDVNITIQDSYPTELLPDGYYRVLEIVDARVDNNTTASLTVNTRGGWEKVPGLNTVTDNRPAVPAVTGFAFAESSVALRLRMQLPTDMNNIDRFRVEFRDTKGSWVSCGSCGGSMPILGDRMDGTYDRIRITSVPKDDSQYQPGVYEAACQLIIANVQDTALSNVAFYSISNATPEPGYSVQVRGLDFNTEHVVVQLAERDNGDGRREELGGDNFFDENGTKGVTCTSFGSYLTDYFPGRYYRVLEVKDVSVTDASTAYLKVKTRGDWSQITLAGRLTYESVTNLQLRDGGGYPELAWNNPAKQPIGARYQVFVSRDGGASWLDGSRTDMDFMKPFLYEPGTYNKVKVATVVNDMEVAASELDINLEVKADTQTSGAQLKLTPISGDEYLCEVTGLTRNTPFAVFFKNQDGTSKREIGTPWSDNDGAFRGVVRLKTSALEYWYIQEFISCSVTSSTTASCTVRNASGWQPVSIAPAVTYQAVSNLHFRMRNYPELTWDIPADQPAGACYRTYLSSDNGQSWQQVGMTTEQSFLVPFVYELGTYNMAKVVTVVNGREVADIAASISLTITQGTALPAASLTLTARAGGGYDCEVTGLTAQTPFTLYFKNAADTENDAVGTPRSDHNGTFRDTLYINQRAAECYFMQEYSNCDISPDGMTATFTVTDRGGWQPVNMV